MKLLSVFSIALTGSVLSGAVWAANPPLDYKSIERSDAELSQKINQQLLSDPNLSAQDWEGLNVAVKNGTVTLKGQVATDAALKEVKRVARLDSDKVVDNTVTSAETYQREHQNDGLHP